MDVSFASLGWISLLDQHKFAVVPHCVEGSVFSKRRALYPTNLAQWLENNGTPEQIPVELDEDTLRDIRRAAEMGRHNTPKSSRQDQDMDELLDDDYSWY